MDKAAQTRQHILSKSFELIYQNGYQATSIDKIIKTTQVTKGAFFYHFKDKEAMGLAMIQEVVAPRLIGLLVQPLQGSDNPLESIYRTIRKNLLEDRDFDIRYGCPLNNLIQEMSPVKDSFKVALRYLLEEWKTVIANELERAKGKRLVNPSVDTQSAAEFIIVSYEGLRGTGKVYEDLKLYRSYLKQLKIYLAALA